MKRSLPAIRVLHFHSPCFDGIASAALVLDLIEAQDRSATGVDLEPVDYASRRSWIGRKLPAASAVVDFLFHPDAVLWADHHQSAFVTPKAEAAFRSATAQAWVYDPEAPSCAGLLWRYLFDAFGHRNAALEELAREADRIDAALYANAEEAVFPKSPASRVNASLALRASADFCRELVRSLRGQGLDATAALPEVADRVRAFEALQARGLDRLRASAELREGDIVVFDVDATDVVVPRYGPYLLFPEARYSVGIVRSEGTAKITAMRNPWSDFPSVPFGKIFANWGGGGHQRVGSVVLRGARASGAGKILKSVVREIRGGAAKTSTG